MAAQVALIRRLPRTVGEDQPDGACATRSASDSRGGASAGRGSGRRSAHSAGASTPREYRRDPKHQQRRCRRLRGFEGISAPWTDFPPKTFYIVIQIRSCRSRTSPAPRSPLRRSLSISATKGLLTGARVPVTVTV
jgi:hypothetical protein